MAPKRLPKFASEAEEAAWLFNHRVELAQDMVRVIRSGRSGEGSRGRARDAGYSNKNNRPLRDSKPDAAR